jgi:hypothetical protein
MEIMRYFKLVVTGASYRILKRRLLEDKIDFSHIPVGLSSNKGRSFTLSNSVPLERILVENSDYSRKSLKRRLLASGLVKNECSLCGLDGEWKGKKLIMVIDHINGICDDNRLENLRMVCPNCNSQLDTTTGKNRRKISNCIKCGKVIERGSRYCKTCRPHKLKVEFEDRPSKEELARMVSETPMTQIGKKYGVSSNSIRKWCGVYGIELERKRVNTPDVFCSCGKKILSHSRTGKCVECFRLESRKVTQRPSKEELEKYLCEMSMRAIGVKYGVSHGTIGTWCRVYGIRQVGKDGS